MENALKSEHMNGPRLIMKGKKTCIKEFLKSANIFFKATLVWNCLYQR